MNSKIFASNISNSAEYRLWHERLGHISVGKFLEIKRNSLFEDTNILKNIDLNHELCEACINGKQARLKFQKFKNKENITRPLFVVHSDVCGPITASTIDNKNYYVVFIDQYTHCCVTYGRPYTTWTNFKHSLKPSHPPSWTITLFLSTWTFLLNIFFPIKNDIFRDF